MANSAQIVEPVEKQPADFFMAIDAALLSSGSLYRVYPDDDKLVLLRIGTYYGPLGVDLGRTVRGGNWLGSLAYAAKPLVSGTAVFASIILIILVRIMIRGKLPIGGALDVLSVFALLGLFIGLFALWIIRGTVLKAKALDELPAADRQQAVDIDRRNKLLTAQDIEKATFAKAAGGWGDEKIAPANLMLTLRPEGKLKLRLADRRDVKAAVRAVKRLIGKENVTVNLPLKEKS